MTRAAESPSLVQRGRLDTPFFRSKFRVPVAPDHFVRRARLVGLLDDLAAYPVTAVVALAGAGKTALAADWLRHAGRRSAWLSLDESDRDPVQLWTAVMTAVDGLAPGAADRALALVRRSAGPDAAVRALVDDLDAVERTEAAVLVVDDLHRVDEDERVRTTLEFFVEHKPTWLHLLLISRRRLPLPVERLRANGTLADIQFEALRFSPDEALDMLGSLCPDAAEADLPAMADWTGGWAAALQLAVLAIRSRRTGQLTESRPDGAVAGPDRLVDEYVWHEVLQAEDPDVIGLLLATSVVDRVNYGLAEALAARPDAGDVLDRAASRGLFVTSLDAGGWFEVHALVREMLLAELGRRWPDRLLEQHARAARWFEGVDDQRSAVEHWLLADQPGEALRILADIAVRLGDAGGGPATSALDRVPPDVARGDRVAQLRYAWCQLLTDRSRLLDAVAAVEAAAGADEPGEVALLRAVADLTSGGWTAAERVARAALGERSDDLDRSNLAPLGWAVVAHGVALDERWQDRSPDVVRARVGVGADAARRTAFEGTRAVGLALAGEPLEAFRVAAGVHQAAEAAEAGGLRTEVALAEALASLELGDTDRARGELEALAAVASYPLTWVQVLARLELVGLHVDDGDLPAAVARFADVEELCRRELDGADGLGWLARTGVRLALAQDDLDGAGHWADRVVDPFWGPYAAAQVDLAAGRAADALERLTGAVARSHRQRVLAGLLVARAAADGDHDAALKSVASAVELAAEHGMLRTVAVDGRAVVDLVELAAWRVPHAWMDRVRRVLVPAATGGAPAALVEPLTDRERDVLRLLPSRLTLREIASELFVSQNTLKFHLRVIYRKLGVNGRAEAVETARQLRLLGRG